MDIRRALVAELRSLQEDLIILEFEKLLDDGVIVNRDGFYYYAA